jgi:AcrR family transcriptional regulator
MPVPAAPEVSQAPPRPPGRPPGRPRSLEAERSITEAVLQLVAENGFDGLSVEGVAARAGVGKGTIYRRWPHKEAMLVDVLASLSEDLPEPPEGQSVRAGLVDLVDTIRISTQDSPAGRLMPRVMAAVSQSPEVMEAYRERVVEPRTRRLHELLLRGTANGELRPDLDVDLAVTLLVGPTLYVSMMRSKPQHLDRATSQGLVDGVLDGLGLPPA